MVRRCGSGVLKLAAATSGAVLSGAAAGQSPTVLVRAGVPLPGEPAGTNVVANLGTAVNRIGGFAAVTRTHAEATGTIRDRIWVGYTLRTQGQVTAEPFETAFEATLGLTNSGVAVFSSGRAYAPIGGFVPKNMEDSLWIGSSLLVCADQDTLTLGGAELYWRFMSRPTATADGRAYWLGGLSPDIGQPSQTEGLFSFSPTAVPPIAPLLLGGQVVNGVPLPLAAKNPVGVHFALSALGTHYMAECRMDTGHADDNSVLVRSGQGLLVGGLLVRKGDLIGLAGAYSGERWKSFGFMGINEQGEWFFTATTTAQESADDVIIKNGQLYRREGATVDGETLTGPLQTAYMNEAGDIVSQWKIRGGSAQALYVNDKVAVKTGDAVSFAPGVPPVANASLARLGGADRVALSARESNGLVQVYFTGFVDHQGTALWFDDFGALLSVGINAPGSISCYANCDGSTAPPILNVADFICFQTRFAAGDPYANCDGSTAEPVLNVNDFICFQTQLAQGCN